MFSDRNDPHTYCVIPAALDGRVLGSMREFFANDHTVAVIGDRRDNDRRTGSDRRARPIADTRGAPSGT